MQRDKEAAAALMREKQKKGTHTPLEDDGRSGHDFPLDENKDLVL